MILERGGSHESGHRDLATGPIRIAVPDPAWNAEADVYEALLNHLAEQSFRDVMKREFERQITGLGYFTLQDLALGVESSPITAGRLKRLKPSPRPTGSKSRIARPAVFLSEE